MDTYIVFRQRISALQSLCWATKLPLLGYILCLYIQWVYTPI